MDLLISVLSILLIVHCYFFGRLYLAYKFRNRITRIIFILQNMVIDDYYNEFFFKEFQKNKNITDNYDEFFGKDIDIMLDSVPKLTDMVFSIKPFKISNWMEPDFYFRYSMFVKGKEDLLYKKYINKLIVANIYTDAKGSDD